MRKVTIKTMDKTGDSQQHFDLDDVQSRAAAQEAIEKIRKGGGMIVTVPGAGQAGDLVQKVEQLAEENVVRPAIVSG